MQMILSPAKNMKDDEISLRELHPLRFKNETEELLEALYKLNYEQLKKVFKTNSDSVTKPMYDLYQKEKEGYHPPKSAAIFAFKGIAYQYLAAHVLEDEDLDYLADHLYILSGLYGLLRPFDGISRYRLEMGSKIPFSLYDFWKSKLADAIDPDEVIVNLASKEYAKVITSFRPVIDIRFMEQTDKGLKEKAVYAKMARGAMVRYAALNKIEDPKELKNFKELGFSFRPDLSNDTCYIFVKEADRAK